MKECLKEISEAEIEEIAAAFADYQYTDEDGLFSFFPDREGIMIYMRSFVKAALKSGWLYAVGENREGYIAISNSWSSAPLGAYWMVIKGLFKGLGMKRCLNWAKAIKKSGVTLEEELRNKKQPFVKIEMLAVKKAYQSKGYMRKALQIALDMAKEHKADCILDTDEAIKKDKYCHLGMKLVKVRQVSEHSFLYDLIKPYNREEKKANA